MLTGPWRSSRSIKRARQEAAHPSLPGTDWVPATLVLVQHYYPVALVGRYDSLDAIRSWWGFYKAGHTSWWRNKLNFLSFHPGEVVVVGKGAGSCYTLGWAMINEPFKKKEKEKERETSLFLSLVKRITCRHVNINQRNDPSIAIKTNACLLLLLVLRLLGPYVTDIDNDGRRQIRPPAQSRPECPMMWRRWPFSDTQTGISSSSSSSSSWICRPPLSLSSPPHLIILNVFLSRGPIIVKHEGDPDKRGKFIFVSLSLCSVWNFLSNSLENK